MQPIVTIILPVSREDYLQRVFSNLEMLECDMSKTNLCVLVDGDYELYTKVRNYTELSKFNERLCSGFKTIMKEVPDGLFERRTRIAEIHNAFAAIIGKCDYVFGVEDDTLVPNNALQLLLSDYEENQFAGFIEGVELGRRTDPYVGAWRADDIYEPTEIATIMPPENLDKYLEPIDAGGFYCFLTKLENYKNHKFKVYDDNVMGPDAEYGMFLRQIGHSNFIDWRIRCIHMTPDENITIASTKPVQVAFAKRSTRWGFYRK